MSFQKIITKYAYLSLILLSLLCGLAWRLEIEYHGWTGLKWLSYFHFAIPFSFLIFIGWANCFFEANLKQRIGVNFTFIAYGVLMYYLLEITIAYLLSGGLLDILLMISGSEWKRMLYKYTLYGLILFIPISGFFILKGFKIKPSLLLLIFSIGSLIAAIILTPMILKFIDHKGGHDYIHAVKSGILIPFIIFSFGLIVIGLRKHNLSYF